MIKKDNTQRRQKIKNSIRKKIFGTSERPRLTVYRSLNQIYGQIVDDVSGRTLVAISSKTKELQPQIEKAESKIQKSIIVGKMLAQKAQEKKVTTVVFDRNGYAYHGRVKALADAAREGGLKF